MAVLKILKCNFFNRIPVKKKHRKDGSHFLLIGYFKSTLNRYQMIPMNIKT